MSAPTIKPPSPAKLGPGDMLVVGSHGMRTRPLRAVLSALGIAIGIAAMVAVLAIPASSAQALHNQFAALGTNLLRAQPGQSFTGDKAVLPDNAAALAKRIGPVTAAAVAGNTTATVRRSDKVSPEETGGLSVTTAGPGLLGLLDGKMANGKFLDAATDGFPVTVLGAEAAKQLGIDGSTPAQVWIGDQWFTVIGILKPMPLAPEIDHAALVSIPTAEKYLAYDGHPTTVYVRAPDASVPAVQSVLGATLNPASPNEVDVSRPSDALAAQNLAENSYSGLFLGLGGVALLVGGVGVANTMVISVLERRREIGLRRALGATRRQVWGQFVAESVLLSGLGGLAGILIGVLATAVYSLSQHWPAVLPVTALLGGLAVSIVVGAIAGAYPAMRAARLSPTQALG
jgi:putative ABC transport system permease protein